MSNTIIIINTNTRAFNSHQALANIGNRKAKQAEKVYTGQKTNRVANDAVNLSISEKMRCKVRGLDQATESLQDGISLIQIAQGALEEKHAILQRTKVVTNQVSNYTLTEEYKTKIHMEVKQLMSEIENIDKSTKFNDIQIFDGNLEMVQKEMVTDHGTWNYHLGGGAAPVNWLIMQWLLSSGANTPPMWWNKDLDGNWDNFHSSNTNNGNANAKPPESWETKLNEERKIKKLETVQVTSPLTIGIQIGANFDQMLDISINPTNLESLGLNSFANDFLAVINGSGLPYGKTSDETLLDMLSTLDTALGNVSKLKENLGTSKNKLEDKINKLQVESQNLIAASSTIGNTDMAAKMMQLTKAKVLQEASTCMLAQANQSPQSVFQLLN